MDVRRLGRSLRIPRSAATNTYVVRILFLCLIPATLASGTGTSSARTSSSKKPRPRNCSPAQSETFMQPRACLAAGTRSIVSGSATNPIVISVHGDVGLVAPFASQQWLREKWLPTLNTSREVISMGKIGAERFKGQPWICGARTTDRKPNFVGSPPFATLLRVGRRLEYKPRTGDGKRFFGLAYSSHRHDPDKRPDHNHRLDCSEREGQSGETQHELLHKPTHGQSPPDLGPHQLHALLQGEDGGPEEATYSRPARRSSTWLRLSRYGDKVRCRSPRSALPAVNFHAASTGEGRVVEIGTHVGRPDDVS